MRMVVTGATGFVGSNFIESVKDRHQLTCIVRSLSKVNLDPKVKMVEANLKKADMLCSALADCDVVVHLAGLGLSRFHEDPSFNYYSTKAIVDSIVETGNNKKLIFLSSFKAGKPMVKVKSKKNELEQGCGPVDKYGLSKFDSEEYITKSNINALILRAPLIYGPGDRNLLPLFRTANSGITISTKHGHIASFCMIHVNMLSKIIAILSEKNINGTLSISDGKVYTWNDLFATFKQIGIKSRLQFNVNTYALLVFVKLLSFSFFLRKRNPMPQDRINDLFKYSWIVENPVTPAAIGINETIDINDGFKQTYEWYKTKGWL